MEQTCLRCGRPTGHAYIHNAKFFCKSCTELFGTCFMCKHNPQEVPNGCALGKVNPGEPSLMAVIEQRKGTPMGYAVVQKTIINPERIRMKCLKGECKCALIDEDESQCRCCAAAFGTCANYDELEF